MAFYKDAIYACILSSCFALLFKPLDLLPWFTLSLPPTQKNQALMHPLLLAKKTNLDAKKIEINPSMKLQFYSLFDVKKTRKKYMQKRVKEG